MKKSEQYLSLVKSRINMLQAQLEKPGTSDLEKEFLESKIKYLRRLVKLPLLTSISTMSETELQLIKEKYGRNDPEFIIELYGLEDLNAFINHKKIVPLQYLKESLLGDYETISTLIGYKKKNEDYENKKQELWGKELDGSISYLQLRHDEIDLSLRERRISEAVEEANESYSLETISELQSYQNSNQSLSMDFILKHKDKIKNRRGMEKIVSRLSGKGLLGKIDKLLPGRKQRERRFLNAVILSYKSNKALATLGIKAPDITKMKEEHVNALSNLVIKQAAVKSKKLVEARKRLDMTRDLVLKQIKKYEALQNQEKNKFISLISTKTKFLPKIFQDQIWTESNLKEELKRVACYQEERILLDYLRKIENRPEVFLYVIENEKYKQASEQDIVQPEEPKTVDEPKVFVKKAA